MPGPYKRARSGSGTMSRQQSMAMTQPKNRQRLRMYKNSSIPNYVFTRIGPATTYTVNEITQAISFEFKLSDMPAYTEFTALFDKYRIDKAEVNFQLINNPNALLQTNSINSNSANNWYPKLYYCRDYDDAATVTLTQIKERSGTKMAVLEPNKVVRIKLKPAVAVQLYKTATTTGYSPKWGAFVDAAQPDVPHYGLKCVVDMLQVDPLQTFNVITEYKLWFTCKDVI